MAAQAEIAVIGAGAAGLMAAITAARHTNDTSVVAVDGASKLGAKILISGGGRCNVTNEIVEAHDFCGATPHAIRKVLRAFSVDDTIAFFEDLGVSLKREATGKLFPTTNRARTVLDALIDGATREGVVLRHPFRVQHITPHPQGFRLSGPHGTLDARRVVLATGGKSVEKTGSDGHGYRMACAMGHTVTRLVPALVPLRLSAEHPLCAIRGVSAPARLRVIGPNGAEIATSRGAVLCTHFGLSGPGVLDISRHLLWRRLDDSTHKLLVSWLADESPAQVDAALRALQAQPVVPWVRARLPIRLATALLTMAGVPAHTQGAQLTQAQRRALVQVLCDCPLPITGPRGWPFAEVTAGGVPLAEVNLRTMQSRCRSGLYLCGEILDVDGRIGGFNFQWAWASGYLAGRGAASE